MLKRQHGVSVTVGHLDRLLCAVIGKIPSLQHTLLHPIKWDGDSHLTVKAVNFRSVCRQAHIQHHTLLSRADDCGLIVAQCVAGADMQLNVSAVRRLDDRLHRRLVQRDRRVRRLDRQRLCFQIKDVVHGADGQRHFFRFQPSHIDLYRAVGFELLFKLVLVDRLDLHGTVLCFGIVGRAVLRLIADALPLGGVDRRLAHVKLSVVEQFGKLVQFR